MGSLLRMCAFVFESWARIYGRRNGGRTARRGFLSLQVRRPTVFRGKRLKLLEKIFGYPPNLHTRVFDRPQQFQRLALKTAPKIVLSILDFGFRGILTSSISQEDS